MHPAQLAATRSLIALKHGQYKIGDPQRHLTPQGVEQAIVCGRQIKAMLGGKPATILTATSYCAIETGRYIGKILGVDSEKVVWLYDAARPRDVCHDIRAALHRISPDGTLILVTHLGQLKQITGHPGDIDPCQLITVKDYN